MIVDEFALPSKGEADYLLHGLARLIRLRGMESFVAAPLLLADARYFPDRMEPRARGVAVLLRRLLAYAGLEPKRLDIEIFGSAERDPHVKLDEQRPQALAWFRDIAEDVYRFGVRETALRDEQGLIGTLGHEVAHAYRAHHGLAVVTRENEEQLTDLTTVCLGFGVFTLESSFQQRAAVQQRREQAAATAEHRCPQCRWVALESDRWLCQCGERWNTFDTRGRCPSCDKQWETTACLSCKASSPHQAWYVD